MSSRTISSRLALAAVLSVASSLTAYGCSSDDNGSNPGPSSRDSGATDGTANGDTSVSSSGGDDSSSAADVPVIDTGSCTPDGSTCNSCYSAAQAAQDPLNACAPETVNCIPFTKTVPSHPTL